MRWLLCLTLALSAAPLWAAGRLPQTVLNVPAAKTGCCCKSCKCDAGQCGDPACPSLAKKLSPKKAGGTPCPCGCGCTDCRCENGECGGGCSCCPEREKELERLALHAQRAALLGRPLLIWVAEVCPPCEAKMPEYVHAHVQRYYGYSGVETQCCVLVFAPDADGKGMHKVAKLLGIPTPEDVRAALAPKAAPAPAPQVMLPPPMMMPMMGGFGGGFGGFGGGFGGGACRGGG